MDIMTQLLENNNFDVPDFARKKEPEKTFNCYNAQDQGKNCYALSSIVE